ncbi:MAG: 23S rRNA (uracil-C(5))-methyltransferase RlmCD [Candidatus Anoxychlamydiales bacterium]|nr:23S rRNA (uracil-C(5))-methyltransferase RlmCD [Candidatus Anoxychlamydiales bacterium]
MSQKKSLISEITIEKFSKKGEGVAFDDNGNKIVIDNAIIGDVIVAELKKKRKGIIKGFLLEILTKSPLRDEPKCSHFEMCGGCRWQNLKYIEQLKQKENFVIQSFHDFIKTTNVELHKILSSDEIFEYRNKMEFSFSQNQKKTKFLGLIMKGKRFVIDIERCYLAPAWFSKVLIEVKNWWEKFDFSAFNYFNGEGLLRSLTIKEGKNTQDKMVMLTLSDEKILSSIEKEELIQYILNGINSDDKISIFLCVQIAKKSQKTTFDVQNIYGQKYITEILKINTLNENIELKFQIGPMSFFQPNTHMAQKLYSTALNYLDKDEIKNSVVFDLYSGTGTIGMILSKFVKKVIAIELEKDACEMAKENMKLNDIKNFEILNGDVSNILDELISSKDFKNPDFENLDFAKPDLVIVDPPRCGLLEGAIKNILKILPQKIIYISCNPITQAEDIKILTENGYKLMILHPVDQFSHTFHIENIAVLKRA